jgi:predicted dithiol-disulfide oxidoreductase (DUF899 family)
MDIVTHDEWLAARRELLAKEKEFTALRDELARERRALPWERVEAEYTFEGEDGTRTLRELFGPHSQLVVYHFMYPPDWEAGCPHCSFWADSFDRNVIHLAARDVSFVAISRAPLAKLRDYRQRMGWSFPWYSSGDGAFTYDLGVAFAPDALEEPSYNYGRPPGMTDREGVSIFALEDRDVFHTYSAYARGIDLLNAAYNYLDLTPKGRDEPEQGNPQFWVRRRDEY